MYIRTSLCLFHSKRIQYSTLLSEFTKFWLVRKKFYIGCLWEYFFHIVKVQLELYIHTTIKFFSYGLVTIIKLFPDKSEFNKLTREDIDANNVKFKQKGRGQFPDSKPKTPQPTTPSLHTYLYSGVKYMYGFLSRIFYCYLRVLHEGPQFYLDLN